MAAKAATGNRRVLTIGGVGLGLLVAVFVATHVLGGGGGSSSSAATQFPGGPRAGAAPATTVPPGPAPTETYETFSGGKNPFTPLVSTTPASAAPATATAAPASAPVATPAVATAGPSVTVPPPALSAPAPAPAPAQAATPPPPAPSNEPRAAQRVAVLDIFDDGGHQVVNVRVNDTVYEKLKPGDTFAGTYKVVALDTQCGTFLFGDDRFRLCQGEEVLK